MKKVKPILFSTEMVESILSGRKTQTRRRIKYDFNQCHWRFGGFSNGKGKVEDLKYNAYFKSINQEIKHIESPFGRAGDMMYIRETWRPLGFVDEEQQFSIEFKDGTIKLIEINDDNSNYWITIFEGLVSIMDKKGVLVCDDENERYEWDKKHVPWRPSIHMPTEIARTWLEIEDIKIQRLRQINEQDAIAEGIEKINECGWKDYEIPERTVNARKSFFSLWDSIFGNRASFDSPFVWVYTFKIVENPNGA